VEKKGLKGYAGVTTFARTGLTQGANARVFDTELDREGRCLMTDHGRFVIFNIYAPTNGVLYSRLPFKLRFLTKLRERMQEQRHRGKEVMLLGDFNIAYRAEDVAAWRRLVDVKKLFSPENQLNIDYQLHNLLRHCKDRFFRCLEKLEITPHVPARKQSKKTDEMYKMVVQMDKDLVEISERSNVQEVWKSVVG
jgi:exonuclease III